MPLLNSVGFNLVKDKLITSADGEKTLKVVAVGYGRTGTVSHSLIAMAIQFQLGFSSHFRRDTEARHPKLKFNPRLHKTCYCPLRLFLRLSIYVIRVFKMLMYV
jgi:hypothetical protein